MGRDWIKLASFVVVYGVCAFAASARDNPILTNDPLPNFYQVTDDLWRSGRPEPDGLALLAQQGLRTIVDLEDDIAAVRKEAQVARDLGINHHSFPILPDHAVDDSLVKKVLSILLSSDKNVFPLLVHCFAGQDRTGMIVGLYRIKAMGWSPADAYDEMLDRGYHPSWTELDTYFRQKTGFNGILLYP